MSSRDHYPPFDGDTYASSESTLRGAPLPTNQVETRISEGESPHGGDVAVLACHAAERATGRAIRIVLPSWRRCVRSASTSVPSARARSTIRWWAATGTVDPKGGERG